nr:unnamed protein product [Digitaria exilis]
MEQRCRRRRKPSSRRANSVHDGEINPSTAPPPPPRVPGWMEPPLHPPPPATTNATWLILDRFVHYSRRRRGVIQGDATTSSLAEDCAGRHVHDVDTIMGADEFFGLINSSAAQSRLPRVQPSFPVMSLVDPDVICFLLIKEEDCNRTWMVEVNMRSKVMLSSALYINEEEEEGHPSAKDCTKGFYGHYFITTKFSYLSKDAITR